MADLNADRMVPDRDGDGKDEDVGLQRTSHNDSVALSKDWSRPENPAPRPTTSSRQEQNPARATRCAPAALHQDENRGWPSVVRR